MTHNWEKIVKFTIGTLGTTFVITSIIAKKKKGNSLYESEPTQKNPLEGKKVIFVVDNEEAKNADGVCGHLEAIGENNYKAGIYERYIKRGLDIILSFCGLVVLSPILLGISIAIVIDDPGPVLFTQKRIGQNKKYFKLHKFRSMKMSTPHDIPTHMLDNPEQYITKIGKFLRAHSLDELPQIWDIFIGNMSVIGPRPGLWNQDLLTAERDKFGANDIKPGLTGWAQINGRDELEIADKAKLDGEYVQNIGFKMDTKVFLRSIHVLSGDDSVVEGGTGELKNKESNEKFLIVTNHSFMLYQFRRELIQELRKYGEVVICTPFTGHENDFYGCKMIEVNVDRRGINPKTDFKLLKEYKKVLDIEKPTKVITYSIKPNIYMGYLCSRRKIQYCVNVQGLGSAFQIEPLASMVTVMYKYALKNAKSVFFENKGNADEFLSRKIVCKEHIKVLRGAGINLDDYRLIDYPNEDNGIHFLFLGRIMKEKGISELFEAMKNIHNDFGNSVILDLVGFFEDEYKDQVDVLQKKGIVAYHGFQTDPRPYYQMSHCVVLPSYHEGMSNVLLEAAATGRAVITSDIPGCREAVDVNVNGLLCNVKDAKSLENEMRKFLNLTYSERKMMGSQGRKKMIKDFDKKDVVRETLIAIME